LELPSAEQLSGVMAVWRARNDVPGAVVGMRLGDSEPLIVVDGEGVGDAPLAGDAPFDIYSITKTFAGALALDLIDGGELGIDDPIEAYVQGFPNADRITVRQLLTHTSGLIPMWGEVGDTPYSQEIYDLIASDLEHSYTPEELLELFKDRPLEFEPGQGVRYSNVNTIVLGAVIEAVTGTDIGTAYRDRLLAPLGLQDTYYRPTEPGPAPVPGLFRPADDAPAQSSADIPDQAILSSLGAGGGMVSTPNDLLDWGVAFLREGALDHADLSLSRFEVAPNGTALGVIAWSIDSRACVFWTFGEAPSKGDCGHFDAVAGIGNSVGTSSMVAYFPRWDLTVVAIKNTTIGVEAEDLVAEIMSKLVRYR
jgi:D-alanyl-D-alanine carboxypeptidase